LVDEVQVEVVEPEAAQRRVEGLGGGLFAGVLQPQFGRDEQFIAAMPLLAIARPTSSSFW
jgi:hypothetical protein